MSNFPLLKEVGRSGHPVLVKRGMMATLDEFLQAAEYILNEGNANVILCERGIRTFETYTRNTLDLSAVPALKEQTDLPVIVDPSHGTGRRSLVRPMALAAWPRAPMGSSSRCTQTPTTHGHPTGSSHWTWTASKR